MVNSKKIIIPIFIDGETGSERLKDSPKVTQPRCGTGERRTQGGRLPNTRSFSSEHLTHHRHTSRALDSFLPGAGSVFPRAQRALARLCSRKEDCTLHLAAQFHQRPRTRPYRGLGHYPMGPGQPVTHLPGFLETFNKTDQLLCVHG